MTDEDRALAFNELITVSKESISKEEGSSVSFYQHKNDSFYLKSKSGKSEAGDPRYLFTPIAHKYLHTPNSPEERTYLYTPLPTDNPYKFALK
ncbi:MAG: hypothetical protein ACD_16C00067G0008 [uncultured bacterium]|nr:MAG: hypothetical protein ACD_16C00067G0008 [uncultured bacterium]OFW68814.1 MAG: hypothetical protein A2X70_00780 [Alphaproteobacteria bacterium GWC2_42_16]OFW73384.1 MAG: hypothetical protein A2Z80_02495 [Alphaproteobacteria bacterium GWA2_41_27]OFW81839.1 MAG: hypothetical protein A3E50_05050 [Alphaproteobacteria bacterium RIFCSPHIGHO2_12_FULL_42_100]OFW85850.1 MAG: hypothetical protein A2W06_01870 [Alphaproteobacteria bacterium RBG_16_42_14]OFW90902.1 MAG: hypothetical protein A3C41_072